MFHWLQTGLESNLDAKIPKQNFASFRHIRELRALPSNAGCYLGSRRSGGVSNISGSLDDGSSQTPAIILLARRPMMTTQTTAGSLSASSVMAGRLPLRETSVTRVLLSSPLLSPHSPSPPLLSYPLALTLFLSSSSLSSLLSFRLLHLHLCH